METFEELLELRFLLGELKAELDDSEDELDLLLDLEELFEDELDDLRDL